jgi:hypothetical protein
VVIDGVIELPGHTLVQKVEVVGSGALYQLGYAAGYRQGIRKASNANTQQ